MTKHPHAVKAMDVAASNPISAPARIEAPKDPPLQTDGGLWEYLGFYHHTLLFSKDDLSDLPPFAPEVPTLVFPDEVPPV